MYKTVELDDNWQPKFHYWTEQDILDFYWEYWSGKMRENRPEWYNSLSIDELKNMCIYDWMVIYGSEVFNG